MMIGSRRQHHKGIVCLNALEEVRFSSGLVDGYCWGCVHYLLGVYPHYHRLSRINQSQVHPHSLGLGERRKTVWLAERTTLNPVHGEYLTVQSRWKTRFCR